MTVKEVLRCSVGISWTYSDFSRIAAVGKGCVSKLSGVSLLPSGIGEVVRREEERACFARRRYAWQ